MATLQYIGARYVPTFYLNSNGTPEWESGVAYEPLTIVTYNNNSYTSRKPVPAEVGNPSANAEYWAQTGVYNAQIGELSDRVDALAAEMKKYFVTPEMFGAVGNGVANDTTAMQDAIDSGYIVLLTGQYLIDTVNITDETYIIGEGGQVIPTLTGAAPAPTKTAFNCSGNAVIDNVEFIGSLSATGDSNRFPVINASGSEYLTVKNCTFTNFGGEYVNISGTAMWDFYAVYIKAVDVDKVSIDNNIFSGNAADETIMITPHTKGTRSEIYFYNNVFKDSTAGASLNLFASLVDIRRNSWINYQYTGSAVNVCCEELFFISNTTTNTCSFENIIDSNEVCLFHAENSIIKDNVIKGTVKTFANILGSNMTLTDNYVEGGGLVWHEVTSRQSDLVAAVLQNTLKRNGAIINISGNTLKCDNNGEYFSIIRAGAVAATNSGLYPANTYTAGGSCIITNNTIIGMGGNMPRKDMFHIQVIFSRVSVRNNTIKNPNKDSMSSYAKFLTVLDSYVMGSAARILFMEIVGNMFYDMNSDFTGGVLAIGQSRGTESAEKPVSIIDMLHNHNLDGNFSAGIQAQYYDELNT